MNFLAHFLLCSEDTAPPGRRAMDAAAVDTAPADTAPADTAALVAGNFLGDFVKGNKYKQYPKPVANGILMHREIDTYTDVHPEFLASKHRLVPDYGHYAGVVVDMFYDHLLALHWHMYSSVPMEQFIKNIYQQLHTQQRLFPDNASRAYQYMVRYNWLQGYARLEGIQRSLEGIASRSAHAPNMSSASSIFRKHYVLLQQEFHAFFPQITRHIASFLP